MRALLIDFSEPSSTMIITNNQSMDAAAINVVTKIFHDPQRPDCPNHQQPSSFCTRDLTKLSTSKPVHGF